MFLSIFFHKFQYYVAFFLGVTTSFSQAPHQNIGALALGIAGMLYKPTYHFKTGVLFGLGYWIGVLYWIVYAFDVYGLRRLGIIAVLLLCLYLSIYKGLAYYLAGKTSYPRIVFVMLWVCFEWVQGNIGWMSFPWGYASFSWSSLPILQSISWMGVYGLSFITLLGTVSLFFGTRHVRCMTLFGLIGIWSAGYYRLSHNPTTFYPVNMRLIQPCISQEEKIQRYLRERNLQIHIGLSNLPAEHPLKAILWPETAFLTPLTRSMGYYLHAQTLHKESYLIIGAPHRNGDISGFYKKDLQKGCLWNGVFVLGSGSVLDGYHKEHLVPFGEYNPLPFGKGFDSFTQGCGPKIMTTKDLPPFRPLICFEAIFPVQKTTEKWRLNLTNDAWYGMSPGPYQHLKIAQIRTIEAGIPLVRVANNGVSAVIDSYGRILYQLKLNRRGIIDFQLPR